MDTIICQVCGTTYHVTYPQCPVCGYAKPAEPKSPMYDSGNGGYQHVKGGRFSNENVRRRNEQRQAAAPYAPSPAPRQPATRQPAPRQAPHRESKPSNKKGSNFILGIIAIILLVVLIISLAWFIVDIAIERLAGVKAPSITTNAPNQGAVLSSNTTELVFTQPGEAAGIIPVITPEDLNAVFAFTVADESVATVDETGIVTAVGGGTTTVTITSGSLTCDVSVICDFAAETTEPTEAPTEPTQKPVSTQLKISHTDVTIAVKETFLLQLRDSDKNAVDVEWVASQDGIVTIDGNKITGAKSGKVVTVSATVDGKTYKCTVRVK